MDFLKNKHDILTSFADSQDLSDQLCSHFMFFNAKKINTS